MSNTINIYHLFTVGSDALNFRSLPQLMDPDFSHLAEPTFSGFPESR